MKRNPSRLILLATTCSLAVSTGFAQTPAYSNPGPVPPAITAAKSIFVSNAGSDSGLFPEPFTGDPGRPYSEFYAGLKASGAYTLTGDPEQADLVLELRLQAPNGPSNPNKQNGASDPVPQFKLVIYDRKTHFVLWTLTEGIEPALMQKTHDRNFDDALQMLLNQFLQLAGKPPAAAAGTTH
jgi:hypothetical protein